MKIEVGKYYRTRYGRKGNLRKHGGLLMNIAEEITIAKFYPDWVASLRGKKKRRAARELKRTQRVIDSQLGPVSIAL